MNPHQAGLRQAEARPPHFYSRFAVAGKGAAFAEQVRRLDEPHAPGYALIGIDAMGRVVESARPAREMDPGNPDGWEVAWETARDWMAEQAIRNRYVARALILQAGYDGQQMYTDAFPEQGLIHAMGGPVLRGDPPLLPTEFAAQAQEEYAALCGDEPSELLDFIALGDYSDEAGGAVIPPGQHAACLRFSYELGIRDGAVCNDPFLAHAEAMLGLRRGEYAIHGRGALYQTLR